MSSPNDLINATNLSSWFCFQWNVLFQWPSFDRVFPTPTTFTGLWHESNSKQNSIDKLLKHKNEFPDLGSLS